LGNRFIQQNKMDAYEAIRPVEQSDRPRRNAPSSTAALRCCCHRRAT